MMRGPGGPLLITGGGGFIGSHLVDRLVQDGRQVHLLVRSPSAALSATTHPRTVTVHEHGGTTAQMHAILQAVRPTLVFHLASHFAAEHTTDDVSRLVESNVLFGTQLVDAMVACRVHALVNAATSWQHYRDENYKPVCLYAATKQAFEDVLEYYVDATPLRAVTLTLFDTYGPGDHRPKLFQLLARAVAQGRTLSMSPGEQLLDLVHVNDVVAAFLVAGKRLEQGNVTGHERYAVSSRKVVRLRDVVDLYARLSPAPLSVEWGGRSYRTREVMVPWRGGILLPDWQPKVTLEEGIRNLLGH